MTHPIYLRDSDIVQGWDGDVARLVDLLDEEFSRWKAGSIMLPEKASQIIDETTQSRVNCMPSTLLEQEVSGVKLVSVFPENPTLNLPNVMGQIVLLSAADGSTIAVLDAAFITALRTALVGGLAARYLAPREPKTIGLLGAGEQAQMHLLVFASLFPSLTTCYVASRYASSEKRLQASLASNVENMNVICCDSDYEKAAWDADIIVTAISGQVPLLKPEWVKKGSFYCHVGGREDEYGVALKSDKIVCDCWEALKHRGSPTLSLMHKQGLLSDDDIYADLGDLTTNKKCGRESSDEIIYFNSIGLAFTDMAIAHALYEQCASKGLGTDLGKYAPVSIFDNEKFASLLNASRIGCK